MRRAAPCPKARRMQAKDLEPKPLLFNVLSSLFIALYFLD
jgi:hypothetical protein